MFVATTVDNLVHCFPTVLILALEGMLYHQSLYGFTGKTNKQTNKKTTQVFWFFFFFLSRSGCQNPDVQWNVWETSVSQGIPLWECKAMVGHFSSPLYHIGHSNTVFESGHVAFVVS